ncbi:AAA family ATPase [Thermosulfurimonas sp. F29]|uniref:AAA family ATPase n=1 Tax=Thermosulfurimonas sp. F29 TaxID=2867247 RepID=UPI001C83C4C6|nr:AAA family ATPase [Thermosulfurimonas sp. F29]MBX6421983.1 AAA family ATPase [Thermosulfurimonas sp. F29]
MSKIKKALEKAGESRQEIIELTRGTVQMSRREEIRPVYTRTKVVSVDSELLRRNKIFSFFDEEEGLSEQLRILHTRILDRMDKLGGNALLITSARSGEGKTLTAINLAISMAREFDRTVLLVDANFKNPTVHTYLGLIPDRGLAHVLLREAQIPEVLINPDIPRLVVMPAGKRLSGSAELLGSPFAEGVFQEIKTRYPERFIIFDSPSILNSADPMVLSEYVDAILMVVEAERTPAEEVKAAVDMLQEKPCIGVVLNKFRN